MDQEHVAGIDKSLYDETAVRPSRPTPTLPRSVQREGRQLPNLSDDIENRIDAVQTQYQSLLQIREQAAEDAGGSSIEATSRVYQRLIAELVTITDISSRIVNDPDIARNLQAIAAATTILETLEEERAIAINVGNGREFINSGRWQTFISFAKLREMAEAEFKTVANRDEQLAFFFSEGGLNTGRPSRR